MEKDELFVIRLRDCFTGGYTLPQYCIDNGIKKPLFVSEEKFLQFIWEIYVQFRYDKRMTAQFSMLDMPTDKVNYSVHAILNVMRYKNFSEIITDDFDAIILLTMKEINVADKVISLAKLTSYFILKTYAEIPLLNFLQRYPKVKLILTRFPSTGRYKDGAEYRKKLVGLESMKKILRKNKSGNVKTPLDKFGYTNEEVLELLEAPPVITNSDGSTVMEDDEHPLMKLKDNKRATAYQPEHFQNKIYIVGSCHDFGINAPYNKTIASYLQKMLNENNLPYCVENFSQRYWNRYQDIFYNMNKLNPSPGDIIFVWLDNMSMPNLPFLNVADAFDPPHDYKEIFCTVGHFNELGYKILAERYFKFLTENNFFRNVEFDYHNPPPLITDTAYRRNSSRAAQNLSPTKNWRLTRKIYVRRKFKSARSS